MCVSPQPCIHSGVGSWFSPVLKVATLGSVPGSLCCESKGGWCIEGGSLRSQSTSEPSS